MEKYNRQAKEGRASSLSSDSGKPEYKSSVDSSAEEKSSESSPFAQVLSQMNIADLDAFDIRYSQLWHQASENKEMLSVLVCEIDDFTAYNEHYGQQAASFMLLVVALELKKKCEEFGCFLAHYKSNKFVILIKGEKVEKIGEIAESLCRNVEKTNTEHKLSKVSSVVTLSIGSSNIYPTSMEMLINEATSALSVSQKSGNKQTNKSLIQAKANSVQRPVVVSPFKSEALKIKSRATPAQNESQPTFKSVGTENKIEKLDEVVSRPTPRKIIPPSSEKKGLRHEEVDMISQLKGITPSSDNTEQPQAKKIPEKTDMLSRFKKMIPSSDKSMPQKVEKSNERADTLSKRNEKTTSNDEVDKNDAKYGHLKEDLKRDSENDTPPAAPAPIRYY